MKPMFDYDRPHLILVQKRDTNGAHVYRNGDGSYGFRTFDEAKEQAGWMTDRRPFHHFTVVKISSMV